MFPVRVSSKEHHSRSIYKFYILFACVFVSPQFRGPKNMPGVGSLPLSFVHWSDMDNFSETKLFNNYVQGYACSQ